MASIFFGKYSVVVKMFPHSDVVPVVVVMPFNCFYPIVMIAFPVVAPDHSDIAKACPTLEFPVREAVFVGDFEFLDAVVVPFVTLEDGAVGVDPDGCLFDAVSVPCEDMFFSPLDCTAGEIA